MIEYGWCAFWVLFALVFGICIGIASYPDGDDE